MDISSLITFFFVFIIFVLILIHYCLHGTKVGRYVDRIPGPKWYPIIGNALDILVPIENLWHFYRRAGRDFYPIYKLWIAHWPVVVIRHPDDIEILLRDNKNISKSVIYDLIHPWLHQGLLTSTGIVNNNYLINSNDLKLFAEIKSNDKLLTGDKWKSRRKIITSAFHVNNLHDYSDNIIKKTESLIKNLKEEAKSGDVDKELLPMVSRFALKTICETIMGTRSNENDSEQDTYMNAIRNIGDIFYYKSVRPWLKNDWILSRTSKGREQTKTLEILHAFTTKIIKERQRHHDESDEKYLEDFSMSSSENLGQQSIDKKTKKKLNVLDLLINASKVDGGIDDRGIREEVDTFVYAGHDTSAMSIFFTILLLAENKDIQARARDEIDKILEENNGTMTINEVQRFTYLERCIKESLRLFPSVPLISREVTEELKLKHCVLPKGTILNISIFDVHRDPNFWPRPNIFDPDRFLRENIDGRHPFCYIPFSGGLRNCIGQKFAMLEIKTIIGGLLHNFYLEPLEITANIRILPDIVLRPAHPVHDVKGQNGQSIDKIPGPRWYPVIGNALDILVHLEDLWHFLRRSGRDFYPVTKFWIINWPVVNIRHPDDLEILLSSNKNITKSLFYDYLHPWLNEGLLTSTGDKWKTRRKIITPAFHLNNLHEYSDNIIEQTERLIVNLKEEAKSGDVDKELLPMVSRFTLNTICETAMGTKLDENNSEQDNYKRSVYDIGNIFYYRAVRPWLKNNWIFSLTPKGRDQSKALKILHEFTTKIIKERKQYHDDTNGKYLDDFSMSTPRSSATESNDKIVKKKRLAFLDLLIAASKRGLGLDDRGIREEVDTFVFEGHDTTAMSIFFTILLLAEHKDIQARAREEIDAILKENDDKMTINEVQRFTYLERCIKESLRLYPSVPAISRKVTENLQLKHCFLPKGTILNIQIIDVHRDPNFWPRPNIYDPDRFLPDRIDGRHPFSYVPFSGGPRNCIGQKFAMLELKTMIGGLLHNFYLEPLEVTGNIRILPDLVLRAAHPVHVKNIPNPPTLPIIGNALDFVGSSEHLWNKLRSLGSNYYPIYKLIGPFEDMVNIRHPDDAEVLLSSPKNITKSVLYDLLHDWFGTGLLTST
ncbi:hypothetical protein PV326_007366, partial [Microctonus aethiopoides]